MSLVEAAAKADELAHSGDERELLYRLRKTCEGGLAAAQLAEREDELENRFLAKRITFEGEEMKQLLAAAINRLGDREKIVLTLYYYEGLTLAEIGDVLGVTESRVCQIHTKAVFQLRSRMVEPERESV